MNDSRQRGQALVLIALAFIGLAAFVGLAIDGGILFTNIGHLRRAADAAALAAANQFREGREWDDIQAAANEFVNLNSLNPATAQVFICRTYFPTAPLSMDDPTLCPAAGEPPRKFVRVRAEMTFFYAFLPIIGRDSEIIRANAISEAASIDLVLVIDTSASMAFDLCSDGLNNDGEDPLNPDEIDDCNAVPTLDNMQVGALSDADVVLCNANRFNPDPLARPNDCHPFEEVRDAAHGLLSRMKFPFDRMALITYAQTATQQISLVAGNNAVDVANALDAMEVSTEPLVGADPCHLEVGDPRGCTSTNTAEGLLYAGNQFGLFKREEAVWIVILLSDGAANAARDTAGNPLDPNSWICPGSASNPTWIPPFCRDPWGGTRHDSADADYDADDAARDRADFVGCPDATSPQPAACSGVAPGGQGAVIFSIGLGNLMILSESCAPPYLGSCEPDLGEQLLRYVAGVGDDNDPATPAFLDPCFGVGTGESCGNYYFSPTGSGLMQVFEAIASRIFTRITH